MAKLYFRYGTVGSAKTLNLLAVAHNYGQQNKKALLVKPEMDVRFGRESIRSRTGLEMTADILVTPQTVVNRSNLKGVHCILVDEAQFLSAKFIDQLHEITNDPGIPVICYGLRTDFRRHLFEGSRRLLELADSVEEVKTTCAFCNKKAVFNLRLQDGKATVEGETIELGLEDKYLPSCSGCYEEKLK
jgi:thymidine kinase